MKINILTICTGKYTVFFDQLYDSCEANLLHGHDKKYFVFTDGEIKDRENVVRIQQEKLGWPYDTMMRFHMFNRIAEQLDGEYTFFLNANMHINEPVGDEVLPGPENNYLVGVQHPGFYDKPNPHFPYERRPQSYVFIPNGQGQMYFQGCFNGGRTVEFLEMSRILATGIESDLSKSIIPIWHDESALNWYYSLRNPLSLEMSYAYPESCDFPFPRKIVQLDKSKVGGHEYLRS